MSQLTERILFLKFVGILTFVKIREDREFLKFIKFKFSIYVADLEDTMTHPKAFLFPMLLLVIVCSMSAK